MAINGNTEAGQQMKLNLPKIKINGTELADGLQAQDSGLVYYRGKPTVGAPATLTFTTTDTSVHLHYTFNGRTPTVGSPLYTGPITLNQNTSSNNTTIKVRAFAAGNANRVSQIVKGVVNVVGGNTTSYVSQD